jgi:hypothetical protein
MLLLQGLPMTLNGSSGSRLDFQVPTGTPPGEYEIEVIDPPGLLEAITVVLLLRGRAATRQIRVK